MFLCAVKVGYIPTGGKQCKTHYEWQGVDCDKVHFSCSAALEEGQRQCEQNGGEWTLLELTPDPEEILNCCQTSPVGCMDARVTCGERSR